MKKFGKGNKKTNSSGIANAVKTVQEKAKAEVEKKNAIFFKLAQALNQAVKGTKSEIVKDLHVEHIVNAIIECVLLDTDLKKRML